jgi:hypothetical protein
VSGDAARLRRARGAGVMCRGRLVLAAAQAVLLAVGGFAASAIACEGAGEEHAESTTVSTKLSGEGKEGEELAVLEGSKVKDKATLSGKNASKATGKVTYKIYSDKECKTLVIKAGEVTVSGESVPASSEEELEAGKSYYWQAHYGGDSKNTESTSPCTEILDVKASEFIESPAESGYVGKGSGTQTFTLNGHKVQCAADSIDGAVRSAVLTMAANYSECEALSGSAAVSEAYYLFYSNGSAAISPEASIVITVIPGGGGECKFTLPESSKAVEQVKYSDTASGIAITAELTGLAYELSETGTTACGTNGEKGTTAEYAGEVKTESYAVSRCVRWWFGGFYFERSCAIDGGGFFELVSGYTSLRWE